MTAGVSAAASQPGPRRARIRPWRRGPCAPDGHVPRLPTRLDWAAGAGRRAGAPSIRARPGVRPDQALTGAPSSPRRASSPRAHLSTQRTRDVRRTTVPRSSPRARISGDQSGRKRGSRTSPTGRSGRRPNTPVGDRIVPAVCGHLEQKVWLEHVTSLEHRLQNRARLPSRPVAEGLSTSPLAWVMRLRAAPPEPAVPAHGPTSSRRSGS